MYKSLKQVWSKVWQQSSQVTSNIHSDHASKTQIICSDTHLSACFKGKITDILIFYFLHFLQTALQIIISGNVHTS